MPLSLAQTDLRQAIEAVRVRAIESGDSSTTREIIALSDVLYTFLDVSADLRQGLPLTLPPIGRRVGKKS
jgi:hypothetical protein